MIKPKKMLFSLNDDGTYRVDGIVPTASENGWQADIVLSYPRVGMEWITSGVCLPLPICAKVLADTKESGTIFTFEIPDN